MGWTRHVAHINTELRIPNFSRNTLSERDILGGLVVDGGTPTQRRIPRLIGAVTTAGQTDAWFHTSGWRAGIATGYGDGRPGFDFRHGQEIFLYFTASRPALGLTQPPIP
jgi:hypothetical protein